jgi:hypothetical protein
VSDLRWAARVAELEEQVRVLERERDSLREAFYGLWSGHKTRRVRGWSYWIGAYPALKGERPDREEGTDEREEAQGTAGAQSG